MNCFSQLVGYLWLLFWDHTWQCPDSLFRNHFWNSWTTWMPEIVLRLTTQASASPVVLSLQPPIEYFSPIFFLNHWKSFLLHIDLLSYFRFSASGINRSLFFKVWLYHSPPLFFVYFSDFGGLTWQYSGNLGAPLSWFCIPALLVVLEGPYGCQGSHLGYSHEKQAPTHCTVFSSSRNSW